jgi:hypothetical protein
MSPVEVVPPDEAVEEAIGAPDAITPTPAAQTVPAAARPTKIPATEPTNVLAPPIPPPAPEPDAAEPGAPELVATAESAADIDSQLARRLQQLVADMQALVSELQERGHLSPDWQPPAPAPQQETVSR